MLSREEQKLKNQLFWDEGAGGVHQYESLNFKKKKESITHFCFFQEAGKN